MAARCPAGLQVSRGANGSLVGELYLADISVPPRLYAEPPLGLTVDLLFARDDIVRVG